MLQFIKFIGVGGFNTLISYALYVILLLIFNYQISYTITYIFGIMLSYWLNLKLVFKEKSSTKKMVLFPLVYLLQYIISIFILYIIVEKFNISELLGPIIIVIITLPITFLLSKNILTKKG